MHPLRDTMPPDSVRAFDRAALTYDETWESLPGTRRIRGIVQEILERVFPPGSGVLELNAGTGTDALFLARRGRRVMATDASPAMVARIAEKAREACVEIETAVLPFEDLARLGPRTFQGVLSNMGGLNCTPDLQAIASELAPHVTAGGRLVLGFMPRFSPWEFLSFLLRGRVREALRRGRPGHPVRVGDAAVRTWYHAPRDVEAAFLPWFQMEELRGLDVLSPPPASSAAARRKRLVNLLQHADDIAGRIPPLNRMGDHCVMVLRRNDSPAERA